MEEAVENIYAKILQLIKKHVSEKDLEILKLKDILKVREEKIIFLGEKQTNLIEDSKEKYKCNKCYFTTYYKKGLAKKRCTRFSLAQNVKKF